MTDIVKLTALQADLIANWLEHKDFRKGYERGAASYTRVYRCMRESGLINHSHPSAKALKAFRMHDQRRTLFPALDSLISARETAEAEWAAAVAKRKADDAAARTQFEADLRAKKAISARKAFDDLDMGVRFDGKTDDEVIAVAEKIRHSIEFF